MKYTIIIVFLLLSICLLTAQDITPWQWVRHSAVDNINQVHVRFNGTPSVVNQYELYYWQNSTWNVANLTNPEPLVYETIIQPMTGQPMNYRLKTSYDLMGQTVVAMNPSFLETDTFPAVTDYLSYIADDPVGDSVMVYYQNLDLTGTSFGFSDNKLYANISNLTNSFPTMNSINSYNMYIAGLANSIAAINDSALYAMVYTFNVPGIFSTGLYKFNMSASGILNAYQRLGNIQAQVVNGKLNMSCNISDLTADPGFGTWPPEFNSLVTMAVSARVSIDLVTMTPTIALGDYSAVAQLIFEHHGYTISQNTLPVISDVSLTNAGNFYEMEFQYTDANQDFPLFAKVIIENMGNQPDITPTIPDFTQPVNMTAILPLEGWLNAQIRISDNNIDFVTYDIINTSNQDYITSPVFTCNVYPNPFNPSTGKLCVSLAGIKNDKLSATVYNLKGQAVKKLSAIASRESSELVWDGLDSVNSPVAEGIYLLRVKHGTQSLHKKFILVR